MCAKLFTIWPTTKQQARFVLRIVHGFDEVDGVQVGIQASVIQRTLCECHSNSLCTTAGFSGIDTGNCCGHRLATTL